MVRFNNLAVLTVSFLLSASAVAASTDPVEPNLLDLLSICPADSTADICTSSLENISPQFLLAAVQGNNPDKKILEDEDSDLEVTIKNKSTTAQKRKEALAAAQKKMLELRRQYASYRNRANEDSNELNNQQKSSNTLLATKKNNLPGSRS
jgi:hypothetical protein